MKENKKCVLILPYFGKFNNYFELFLKSIRRNREYELLLLTDNYDYYDYPDNVKLIHITLQEVRNIAVKKFGFGISLEQPYKLCDYKPAYGFLFEEYISDYDYWGHCDCDLIFGNLDKLLTPVLEKGYDKLFAAGHLTLYKNNFDNNRRFMKSYQGEYIYKDAFTTNAIYVLDEDFKEKNVHRLFLADNATVYQQDLSMNPTSQFGRFRRSYYNPMEHKFSWEPFKLARYYWENGNIVEVEYNKNSGKLERREFIYMHLQMRKMRVKIDMSQSNLYQILPDRFIQEYKLPETKREMKLRTIRSSYLYWYDTYKKRFIKKYIK